MVEGGMEPLRTSHNTVHKCTKCLLIVQNEIHYVRHTNTFKVTTQSMFELLQEYNMVDMIHKRIY